MAKGGGLLNRYTGQNLYRGFESPPLRQSHRIKGIRPRLKIPAKQIADITGEKVKDWMPGPEEWPSRRSNPADKIRLTGPAALQYAVACRICSLE